MMDRARAISRFPARASGPAERVTGFLAHLRMNGVAVGAADAAVALAALSEIQATNPLEARLALKSVLATDAERFARFDDLFTAYFLNGAREKAATAATPQRGQKTLRTLIEAAQASGPEKGGKTESPDDQTRDDHNGDTDAEADGEGRLIASRTHNLSHRDLREFLRPEDLAHAERVAERLARAMRDRRSRRERAQKQGARLDLRRTARKSVASGGEPFTLLRKQRPDRPVNIVALLDVSGSMTVYARVFLAFLKGLVSAESRTEAFLFHTRLVKISDALRDRDTLRAVNRLTMMAEGFGGGTRIGANLERFNAHHAARSVNGRTVVILLSDGYDTDPPPLLAKSLARLRKRGCKIIWLNPLKGWKDYQPVARGMAAALPHIDLFASANTLASLAALEPHLSAL